MYVVPYSLLTYSMCDYKLYSFHSSAACLIISKSSEQFLHILFRTVKLFKYHKKRSMYANWRCALSCVTYKLLDLNVLYYLNLVTLKQLMGIHLFIM